MTESIDNNYDILIVDDLPENLQLLTYLLTKKGYNVRSVTTGKMALRTLKAKQPNLILLDIIMPEMDGYQVCQAIKKDQILQDIPIIFISALDEVFDKVKAFQCGGVDYISKPFEIEEVIVRVENQLIIQGQKKALQEEINRRREAEIQLSQSKALLINIFNSSLDGMAALEAVRNLETGEIKHFRCLMVNQIIAKYMQQEVEKLIGQLLLKKFFDHINPLLFPRLVQVVETGQVLEDDFHYSLGQSSWFHFMAVKLGDGFSITVRDITSRKKSELQLQQANRKLQFMANVDPLTKIPNRRRFNDFLKHEWLRHLRSQESLALILMDIDYFKNYNDYYGHQGGDLVLKTVAQTIAKVPQRRTDIVARYGGEEFAAILPHTTTPDALRIAEMIRQAIEALQIPHLKSKISDYVTLSLGVASLVPHNQNTFEDLIKYADEALYLAKQNGRNQVKIHQVKSKK